MLIPPYPLLEVAMRLTHKTTVLLSERLHRQLSQLAEERGQSMGELVRQACERQYGMADVEARLAAVEALRAMRLPVGPVEQMIAESVAEPQDLPD
jgi:predicted DNA-binding protein